MKKVWITNACFSLSLLVQAQVNDKPNIVFILADDLGWTDTGCTGSDFYETPNIDALRASGVLFTHAYTNAANSAPSRASIMTGLYTPRHEVYTVPPVDRGKSENRKLIPKATRTTVADTLIFFSQLLQINGYRTVHIGKWHLGSDNASNGPMSRGFDVNIAGDKNGSPYSYYYPFCNNNNTQCLTNLNLNDSSYQYLTDRLTQEAVMQIKETKDQPLFLYMSHYAVHTPLQGKDELVAKYENKKPGVNHQNPVYAAMVESLDQSVGRIIQALKDENKLSNTLIVFLSDNGGMVDGISSNAPLRGGKGTPYEGGNRVPLIFSYPDKIAPNQTNETNVIGFDLFPTFLDFANISVPNNLDGVSLKESILTNEDCETKRDLFFYFPAYLETYGNINTFRATPYSSIISGNWKLIYFFEDNSYELYNLKNDIGEKDDLSKVATETSKLMLYKLNNWFINVGAPTEFEINPDAK